VFAIETNQLTRSFGKRVAVDTLTLQIPAGHVFGFLGPNGAGKTTTVRMLAGLIAPSSGTARVAGYTIGQQSDAVRRAVGLLTETPGLYDKLTARQNLVFFGQMYDLTRPDAEQQAQTYLQLLGLWERRDDTVGGFSKGMRQKLAIARALLHNPQVVFLDEPTSGLDPEAARTVRDSVRALRDQGRTVFLTTHNLNEVDELCDLVGVFRSRLVALGTPDELRSRLFGNGTIIRMAGNAADWIETVRSLAFVRAVVADKETLTVTLDDPEQQNPELVRVLAAAGAPIRYVEAQAHSLEDVYFELVGNQEERPR
jgi:ABC-2 type transport system ATP-binding protein